mgnify:CR=1 FL=1
MNLIDTHSHLYGPEFDEDREEALARAAGAGVGRLLLPAIDSESHDRLFDLCRLHPQRCVPMIGLHPTSVNDNPRWQEELELVEQLLAAPPEGIPSFCAISGTIAARRLFLNVTTPPMPKRKSPSERSSR